MLLSVNSPYRRRGLQVAMILCVGAASLAPLQATAGREGPLYEVRITNATYAQQFTPLLLVTHEVPVRLFEVGSAASAGLATLAEEGNVVPLRAVLDAEPKVNMTTAGAGLTNPGTTVTLSIRGRPFRDKLSLAAMLIPTNDAFVALDAVDLPVNGSVTYTARAYDAGSEVNDELCASIPGPAFAECGGPGGGGKPGGGEGFVHVHRGVQGVGDLDAADRTWQNPVAFIRITRVQ
jgi:hypothetical protein